MSDVVKPVEQFEKLGPQTPDKAALERTVGQAVAPSDQVRPATQSPEQALKQNLETSPPRPEATAEARIGQSPDLQRPEDLGAKLRDVSPHQFSDRQGRTVEVKEPLKADSPAGSYRGYRAYHEGREVGDININFERTSPNLASYDQAKIMMVEVAPEYRGAGIGEHLVKVGESSAHASGVDCIYGDPKNDGARQFFGKQEGWQLKQAPGKQYGEAEKRFR